MGVWPSLTQASSTCGLLGLHKDSKPVQVKNSQLPAPRQDNTNTFLEKVKAAWHIFFPPKPEKVSAREAGKSRLRMILVADRYPSFFQSFL